MKIVLLGAPCSGKGTQSGFIKERYGLCHLSTGDMLREAVDKQTPNGLLAKKAMDKGELVSDSIVFGIVREKINQPECKNGYVLDGFPRRIEQAVMMEQAGERIDMVIDFNIPDDVLLKRMSGRWVHKGSGRTYHEVFNPPKKPGVDDITGEPLIQRADDRVDIAHARLEVYKTVTAPLTKFYKNRDACTSINANLSIEEVRNTIASILDPFAVNAKPK